MLELNQSNKVPELYLEEDAFGGVNGRCSSIFETEAKHIAAVQAVEAVGRRPEDWVKRDLLVMSSGDERRNWFFKKVLKNESKFLNQAYDQTHNDYEQRIVRSSRAFDYLHRRHLLENLSKAAVNSQEYFVLARASVCPTALFQTNVLIGHKFSFVRYQNVCKNAWACPHCYSRAVAEEFVRYKSRLNESKIVGLALISDYDELEIDDLLSCSELHKRLNKKLLGLAKSMGATGGILAFQLSPDRYQELKWDYNEAYTEQSNLLTMRVAVMAIIPETESSIQKLIDFNDSQKTNGELLGNNIQLDYLEFRGEHTIRTIVAAKSEKSESFQILTNNKFGLFYWPPIWLCSPEQWDSRFRMTKSKKAFTPWGDWVNFTNHSGLT